MRYKPRTKPFGHQSKASLRAVREGNLAFFHDPGCGKTKAALDAIAIQALRQQVQRVVVIAPIMAIGVWYDQIREHFPFAYTISEALARDTDIEVQRLNRKRPDPRVDFFLINYDKFSQRDKKSSRWVYTWEQKLYEFDPQILVLDESHRVKSAGSTRSRRLWLAVRKLRKQHTTYVYLFTGMPNPKGYIDVFAQYRIMDETVFGTNRGQFEEEYCIYGRGTNRYKIVRYRNTRALKKKIREHAHIVPKHKALDLPEQTWQNIPVQLPKEVKDAYRRFAEDLIVDIAGHELEAENAGVRALRLRQLTGGYLTNGRELHRAKVNAAEEILRDLYEQGQHAVVYAAFISEVDQLADAARRAGYEVGVVTGAVKQRPRAALVRWFQQSTTPACLVFQVDTGSLAITLTRAANVLFYSLPQAWDTYYQACSRVHRAGQESKVTYRHLICPGTVDVSMIRMLRGKADMHGELMKTPRSFLFGL